MRSRSATPNGSAMRLADLIQSLQKTDPLSEAYKTRACRAMSYPKQPMRLPDEIQPTLPAPYAENAFEAALKASGLMAIVEHLYPHETSQRQ